MQKMMFQIRQEKKVRDREMQTLMKELGVQGGNLNGLGGVFGMPIMGGMDGLKQPEETEEQMRERARKMAKASK